MVCKYVRSLTIINKMTVTNTLFLANEALLMLVLPLHIVSHFGKAGKPSHLGESSYLNYKISHLGESSYLNYKISHLCKQTNKYKKH